MDTKWKNQSSIKLRGKSRVEKVIFSAGTSGTKKMLRDNFDARQSDGIAACTKFCYCDLFNPIDE